MFFKMREYKLENNILYVKCNKCGRFLELKDFYKSNKGARGVCCHCKECRNKVVNKSLKKNHKRVSNLSIKTQKRLSLKYGFNRHTFHMKAIRKAKKIGYPEICPICQQKSKIQIHHPSYKSFEDWNKIIFCCRKCHQKIHNNEIKISSFIYLDK